MGVTKTIKTLTLVNQPDGFDCPGCAWPDPEHSSPFEFCENGAKAVADEATSKRITAEFFSNHTIQELSQKSDFWLNNQGRLTSPMYISPGKNNYKSISWDEAFSIINDRIKASNDRKQICILYIGQDI